MSAHKSKMKKKCKAVIRKKILDHSSLIQRQAKLFNPYYSIIWEIRNSFKSDRGKTKSYQNKRNKAVVLNYRQICTFLTSLVAQIVKHLPKIRETQVQSLGQEDPLKKEMETHSSTLAWRIPWMEDPVRLQSMGSQRVGHD